MMLTTLQRDGETRRALWPKLAREGQMVRSIDPDARYSEGPSGRLKAAALFGTRVAEPILAAVHMRPCQQTEHMIAIASNHTLHSPCKPGAVHIWVPAGVYPRRGRGRASSIDRLCWLI